MAMTRRRQIGLSAMVVRAAAVGVFYLTRPAGPPALLTQPITRGDVVDAVGATGTVEAVTTAQVGTQRADGTKIPASAGPPPRSGRARSTRPRQAPPGSTRTGRPS